MNSSGSVAGGYVFLLPVLMTVVWIVSWRRPGRQRWALLGCSGAVALLVAAAGLFIVPLPGPGRPLSFCSSLLDCDPGSGLFWYGVGIYGVGWFVFLLLLTSTIDLIRIIVRPR